MNIINLIFDSTIYLTYNGLVLKDYTLTTPWCYSLDSLYYLDKRLNLKNNSIKNLLRFKHL